ncbi:VOC family protein [Ferruginibacter sp. SUN002]|uniref:VOC family protein n=1 Tax=Ferruginibacter sp. SUN002 TaxID=2937789 RepID=UPI003D360DD6
MIKGIYETHINVENLERSVDFYKNVLGLEQCSYADDRRIAFFWVGKPREYMLGLWEKPKSEIVRMHFAFRCDKDDILNRSVDFLKERNLKPYNFLKDGTDQPMVFAWMPALAIYFDDPDGHCLEFISILDGEPNEALGIITYEAWQNHLQQHPNT